MNKTNKPCRITGLTCGAIDIHLGATGELTLKSESVLQDSEGNVHGRTSFIGPWSEDVVAAVDALKTAIEKHLLTIHFEEKKDDNTTAAAPGESVKPTGLFGARLGYSGTEAAQLREGAKPNNRSE
jgi:hypothetical protein